MLIDPAKPVEIYKNLHKKCWSVRQGGKVRLHTDYICLKDCKFVVGVKGRERVLREKKKNVHSFVKGFLCHPRLAPYGTPWTPVSYNPYKHPSFFTVDKEELIKESKCVDMCSDSETPVLAYSPS